MLIEVTMASSLFESEPTHVGSCIQFQQATFLSPTAFKSKVHYWHKFTSFISDLTLKTWCIWLRPFLKTTQKRVWGPVGALFESRCQIVFHGGWWCCQRCGSGSLGGRCRFVECRSTANRFRTSNRRCKVAARSISSRHTGQCGS